VQETPAEYTKRMLKYTRNQDALKIQQSTLKKIEHAIRRLTRKQMMTRPAPDKWSIGEILAHLAEAELVGGYRMRLILSANGTAIQALRPGCVGPKLRLFPSGSPPVVGDVSGIAQRQLAFAQVDPQEDVELLWDTPGARQRDHCPRGPDVRRPRPQPHCADPSHRGGTGSLRIVLSQLSVARCPWLLALGSWSRSLRNRARRGWPSVCREGSNSKS